MPELIQYARAAIVTLAFFQCLLLLARVPACRGRAELAWFGLTLIFITASSLLPANMLVQGLSSLLIVWAAGTYCSFVAAASKPWLWHIVLAACALAFALPAAMGFQDTMPYALFAFFAFALLCAYPLALQARAYRESRYRMLAAGLGAQAVLFLALGYELLSRVGLAPQLRLTLWATLAFLLLSGYRLSQEGYLLSAGWPGLQSRLVDQEQRLQRAYSRLLQTEDTLLLQDRLVATGLLSAGAAHEFKNVLAFIQAAAEFGLDRRDALSMSQALQLIIRHAGQGKQAVTDLLDQVVQRGRERLEGLRLPDDLRALVQRVRATYRREGIQVSIAVQPALAVSARRGELEQVLLNLIRNAADSIRQHREPGEGTIRIQGSQAEGSAVIEVVDNGGGVAPELGGRIFDFSVSEKSSTGLGLYLARKLAERNGGSLDYIPAEGGSCFRLVLPLLTEAGA